MSQDNADGIYLYCVAEGNEAVSFGCMGIEGNDVYTILYKGLCVVVHDCSPEPYKSENEEIVKKWVITHQNVVDKAWETFCTVLPLGFDTIIKGEGDISADDNLKKWLEDDYDNLKQRMEKVKDKAEYGVQVFWNPTLISQEILEEHRDIKKLKDEMESKPKGTAYMYKQKLENAIRKEMEKKADECFKEFYGKIKGYVDDTRVEKTKKVEEGQMLINLSCLVYKDKSSELGEELGEINKMKGFSVRFTGPWPPYSFVTPG